MLPRSSSGFENSGWGMEDPGWGSGRQMAPFGRAGTAVPGDLALAGLWGPRPRRPQLPCWEESGWGESSEIFSLNANLPFLFS